MATLAAPCRGESSLQPGGRQITLLTTRCVEGLDIEPSAIPPWAMRYWWVNQNQTYRHEVDGGYLWSPKRNKNGSRNQFYQHMREAAPGDVVLSFRDTRIAALGIVKSYCYESPKPPEFGTAGANWEDIGWRVDTAFTELQNRVRPKDFVGALREHLPEKYSPLLPDGRGLQSVYLAAISPAFAYIVFNHVGREADATLEAARSFREVGISRAKEAPLEQWEEHEVERIRENAMLAETDRLALIQARRGQGQFRSNVRQFEAACRVTRVERQEHLIASHIQPWRASNNNERLDGENGLLLTPTIDHLFDRGFISFENKGAMILSPIVDPQSLAKMGIDPKRPPNVGEFSSGQRRYLDYHRDNVLKMMHR